MSNLLQVARAKPQALARKGTTPLIVDIQVSPETAPYLVSSSTAFMWVEGAFDNKYVRAAVRKAPPGEMFFEAVQAIAQRSRDSQWGSVHPFSVAGIRAAIEYVESFEVGEVEVLMSPEERPEWATPEQLDCAVRPTLWLPPGWAIVVPVDREFVGLLLHLGPAHVVSVIHNAARGVGVATGA